MTQSQPASELHLISLPIPPQDQFIAAWGSMAGAWGVPRTLAMIHGYLLMADEPACTDTVMEELNISRGNANTNLRELVSWGLIRSVSRRGDRKEYFEAECDVWKMFSCIARARKRRELDPALAALQEVLETDSPRSEESLSSAQRHQLREMLAFLEKAQLFLDFLTRGDRPASAILPHLMRIVH